MSTNLRYEPIALTGGRWVSNGRGTLVWEIDDEPLSPYIACPTCRVRSDQHCITAAGSPRKAHWDRISPRVCGCGEVLGPNRGVCDECRYRTRRRTWTAA